jgi:hypothetical protein
MTFSFHILSNLLFTVILSFNAILSEHYEINNKKIKNIKHDHKVKLCCYMPWRRLGERRYSSYSFLTSAIDGGEWSASHPGCALPLRKEPPVPIG